jgi:hypothetical protein
MAKDWRISICTRYRPLTVLSIVIVVCAASILSLTAIQRSQKKSMIAKFERIPAGTAKARLIELLGIPQRKEEFRPSHNEFKFGAWNEELERAKSEHPFLVEYIYDKTFFGDTSPDSFSVYLDENEQETVAKPIPNYWFWVPMTHPNTVVFLFWGVLAPLVWLCFRAWCSRQMDRSKPEIHPQNPSGT